MSRIRILATSDMHGYIYPYSYAAGKPFNGGMARLKTICDSLRDEQTLLIDNGDVLEGSPSGDGTSPVSTSILFVFAGPGSAAVNTGAPSKVPAFQASMAS